jgi:Glycosyltransferase family 9 (heptosyltransferase)
LPTILAEIPYLFAHPVRVAAWRERLGAGLPPGMRRIGLAWTGRRDHPNDRRRSLELVCLTPLATAGRACFVALQKPLPQSDVASMSLFPGLADMSGELTDFGETAALIANLDLVITVDTVIGHLAGALGKPVWILLPKAADWRWLLERSDSPWYPTARLFRQKTPGAWQPVIAEMTAVLANNLSSSREGMVAG